MNFPGIACTFSLYEHLLSLLQITFVNYKNIFLHSLFAVQVFSVFCGSYSARSFTTSAASSKPAAAGTKALLPGIARRCVHFLAVPGGQMQCARQLIAISSTGVIAGSLEYTTFKCAIPRFRNSCRMTRASGQTEVL